MEEIKLKKKQAEDEYHALIPRHAVQQQKLKACEVSQSVQLHPTMKGTKVQTLGELGMRGTAN